MTESSQDALLVQMGLNMQFAKVKFYFEKNSSFRMQ